MKYVGAILKNGMFHNLWGIKHILSNKTDPGSLLTVVLPTPSDLMFYSLWY